MTEAPSSSAMIPELEQLITGLKCSDPVSGQNALGALCVAVCHSEARDLLAKRCDAILAPLVVHLMSDVNGLIHNASLLLGNLLHCAEFRRTFAGTPCALDALVALLEDKRTHEDLGVVCNVTWALRQIASDKQCTVDHQLAQRIKAALPLIVSHADPRIQINALPLSIAMQQHPRKTAIAFRRDKSLAAVCALTRLAGTRESPKLDTKNKDEEVDEREVIDILGSDFSFSHAKSPPVKRRYSLLAPWKKKCAAASPLKKPFARRQERAPGAVTPYYSLMSMIQ